MKRNEDINRRHERKKGVSLIETAILITLIGLMVGPAIQLSKIYTWNIDAGTTTQSTATVRQAIDAYYARNGRYPCPAPVEIAPDTTPSQSSEAFFGQDSAIDPATGKPKTTGVGAGCTGAIPGTADMPPGLGTSNVRVGSVPTRELGLPDSAMLDGWGNRLVYAVTESYAGMGSKPGPSTVPPDLTQGGILIQDKSTPPNPSVLNLHGAAQALVYFIMAPGPDTRGAYSLNGTVKPGIPGVNFAYENCLAPTTCTSPATFTASSVKSYDMADGTEFTNTFSYMLAAITNNIPAPLFAWNDTPGLCLIKPPLPQLPNTQTEIWYCDPAGTSSANVVSAAVLDHFCTDEGKPKPTPVTTACPGPYVYKWVANTGACSNQCPKSVQTTTYECWVKSAPSAYLGFVPAAVPDAYCTDDPVDPGAGPKPPTTTSSGSCTPSCTYTLNTAWGACGGGVCGGAGTLSETNTCLRSDGAPALMSDCAAAGLAAPVAPACNMPTCTGYSWSAGNWGACNQLCGPTPGSQSRNVICVDSSGQQVGNADCPAATMPVTSQACNATACPATAGVCISAGTIGNIIFLTDTSGSMAYPIVQPSMLGDTTLKNDVARRNADENVLIADEKTNTPSPYVKNILSDRLTVANDDTAVRDRLQQMGLATSQNSRITAAISVLSQVIPEVLEEKAAFDPTNIVGVANFLTSMSAPIVYNAYPPAVVSGTSAITPQILRAAKAPIVTQISKFVASGSTPLLNHMMAAADVLGNGTALKHNALVVLSDGVDNESGTSIGNAVAYIASKYPFLDINIVDVNGNQVLSTIVNTPWTITAAQAAAATTCPSYVRSQGFQCDNLAISPGTYTINGTYIQVSNPADLAAALLAASNSCTPPPVNYIWDVGDWGACSANCGAGGQSRAVTCTDATGILVSNVDCPQPAPILAEACDLIDCKTTAAPAPVGNAITAHCDPTLLGTNPTIWSATKDLTGQFMEFDNMPSANLVSYNLTDADFFDATLNSANLQGANVTQTDFTGADLDCANLKGLNLSGSSFGDADLSYANLQGANLTGADLSQVNLSNADLTNANLTGSILNGAVLNSTVVTAQQISTAAVPPPSSPLPSAAIFQAANNPVGNGYWAWTVPTGVTTVTARLWGSGGGGGCGSAADQQGNGGGGGYTQADITVTPGQTLYMNTQGGAPSSSVFGGAATCKDSGGFGGTAAVVEDAAGILGAGGIQIIAGGGGGGGGGKGLTNFDGGNGGPGSGAIGINGNSGNDPAQSCCNAGGYGGFGATTAAVGNGGKFGQLFAGNSGGGHGNGGEGMGCSGAGPVWSIFNISQSMWGNVGGTYGEDVTQQGAGTAICGGGGGGGGGYYGGGGGAATNITAGIGGGGGGGGGSGIALGTGVSNPIYMTGQGTSAANMNDPYYISGTGMGTTGSTTTTSGPIAGGPAAAILTYTCGTPPCLPSTDPQEFQFIDQTNVPMVSLITSNAVTLAGGFSNATALCSPVNYCAGVSINGGAFTAGTVTGVNSGDTIAMQMWSASSISTPTPATVFVGATQSLYWTITTTATPAINPFSFTAQTGVPVSTLISSNAVTLTGGLTNQTATCNAGCVSISINGAAFVAGPVAGVNSGDTIAIRQLSSASLSTPTTASVTVGATPSGIWTVTTPGVNPFSFTNQTNVATGATITSNAVALAGGFTNMTATCNAGCTGISINGGAFTAGPVPGVNSGDTIAIEQTSSPSISTLTTASVTVGPTASTAWTVTTGTTGSTVTAFSFTNQTNVATSSAITSNAVALAGGFANLTATCNAGCTGISINGGAYVPGPVTGVNSGNTIAIRQTSSVSVSTLTSASVTVGTTTSTVWTVTTAASSSTASAFSFTNQTNTALNVTITSNTVTLAGGFSGATATCSGACNGISINGGAFVGGPVTGVNSGDTIAIQLVSSTSPSTPMTATVTVGTTTSSVWSVTTGTGGGTVSAFSFTNQTGVPTNMVINSSAVTLGGGFTNQTATCTGACTMMINGGSFVASPITGVNSGDILEIRMTSSASALTMTSTTVTVGGTSSPAWQVTTGPGGAGAGHDYYVMNSTVNTVSAVNLTTNTVDATITVCTNPQTAANNGTYEYVSCEGTTTYIYPITMSNNAVGTPITVGTNPFSINVTPDGTKAYVVNMNSGNVSVLNTSTNTVTTTIPLGATTQPGLGVFDPTGAFFYVMERVGGKVAKINTSTDTVVGTLTTGGAEPFAAAINSAGTTMYVTDYTSNTVTVINLGTFTITGGPIATGIGPQVPVFDKTGAYLYTPNYGGNSVSVIATATNTLSTTVTVGTSPLTAVASNSAPYIYVNNYGSNSVSIIHTTTNTVFATPAVGTSPWQGAIDNTNNMVYVANYNSSSVSVINTATSNVATTVTVGTGPWFVDVPFTPTGGSTVSAFSFTDQTGVGTSATINSNTVTLAGGFTNATATCNAGCNAISINGGAFVAGPVTGVNSGDTIAIELFSTGTASTPTTASVTVGSTTSGTWTVTTGTGGTVNAFSFTNQTGVALSSNIVSNTVTLAGGFSGATATCNAGCIGISLNGGGFVSGPVTGVNSGVTIAIEMTSSASASTPVTASVTVGATTSSIWSVTTGTGGSTVNPFSFTDMTGVVTNLTIASEGGINPGDIQPDGTIYTGLSPDGNIDMFIPTADQGTYQWSPNSTSTMTACTSASPGAQTSCRTGQNDAGSVESLDAGAAAAYACMNSTAYGHNDWYLPAQDELNVLYMSQGLLPGFAIANYWSSSEASASTARLQFFSSGAQSSNSKTTTASVRCVRKASAPSATVTLSGSFTNATATCNAGCTGISVNYTGFVPGPVTGLNPGDTIVIEQMSSASPGTPTTASVTVGTTTSSPWTVTTAGGSTVNAFSFTNQTGVATSSTITSNTVTLGGGFTNATITCNLGCTAMIVNGINDGLGPITGVNSGMTLAIQQHSSASAGTLTTAHVTVGPTQSGAWTVTTAGGGGTYYYVGNSGSNTISAINSSTNAVAATIPVGGIPSALAHAGSYEYVACSSNDVYAIDTSTNTITSTIPVGTSPNKIIINPAGTQAWVLNYSGHSISVISTSTNAVIQTIPVGGLPLTDGVFDSTGTFFYVVEYGFPGDVVKINASTGALVGSPATVGTYPMYGVINSAGTKMYVTNYSDGTVSVITLSSFTVTKTITVSTDPNQLAFSPSGAGLYVVNWSDSSVSVIATASDTVSTTITNASLNSPNYIYIDSAGYAYIPSNGVTSVVVINTATNTVVATPTVGTSPDMLTFNSAGSMAYVTNYGSGTISVINTSTNTVAATVTVGTQPLGVDAP